MKEIAKYFYEIGQLKRVKRSGWWMVGIDNPESVAEHSLRTAIIGYVLAYLEGADPFKTAAICLFHDTHETRILDLHRVAKRYIHLGEDEEQARREQVARLPEPLADEIATLMSYHEMQETPEGVLAHDADALECLIQAREYQTQGYTEVEDWIINCQAVLRSESAKNIADECLRVEPREWWQGLKQKMESKKA